MSKFWRRLRILCHRDRFDSGLAEEMRDHLEMLAQENEERGMSPGEARRAARRQLGNTTWLQEESREMWGWPWLEMLIRDVRHALRTLLRSPGFVVMAVLSLGLGIGVNTAIFSIVDSLLFRPLPVPQSDRLVSLQHRDGSAAPFDNMSFPDYLYYRDHTGVFTGLVAHSPISGLVGDDDSAVSVDGEIVSANYFDVLGISLKMGRWFTPGEDDNPGTSRVVVLGYVFWQRRFGGDPAVLGNRVTINGYPFTVVGVAPRGFAGLPSGSGVAIAQFWVPVSAVGEILPRYGGAALLEVWNNDWICATGRLKDGVGMAEAEGALRVVSEQLRGQWETVWADSPGAHPNARTPVLVSASQARVSGSMRQTVAGSLGMLAGIVGLVLLMACVNVAGLVFTRGLGKKREIAVRRSLGAGRGAIVRHLLIESLLLAGTGCVTGLMVARWTVSFLSGFQTPFGTPLAITPEPDIRVLIFAVALSGLCAVLAGLAPATRAARSDLSTAMKADSEGTLSGSRLSRVRGVLVAAQVALSLVFLTGAGLFLRTLANARAADTTVDPGNVLLTQLDLADRDYDQTRGQLFYDTLAERLHALPGVRSAALVFVVPLGGRRGGTNIKTAQGDVQVDFNVVSPRYFETVGIPILRGRGFTTQDRAGSPGVALINEQFAERFFPGEDPIGRQIDLTFPQPETARVVGIVRDGPFRNVRQAVQPCFYVAQAQLWRFSSRGMWLEVRTERGTTQLAHAVRREILALDGEIPLREMSTLRSHRESGLSQERLLASLLTGFALLALVLAAIGIYGVVSSTVAQRTRELGLRMALGADARNVVRLVLGGGLLFTVAGVAVGVALALGLTRFVSSLLFGVSPTDPFTFLSVSVLLVAVALLAAAVPARRATRIAPMEALRHE